MSLESAESAALRVIWTDPESHYDLRWYGAPDFIVPVWWIGVSELSTGELQRTEVLAPKLEAPAELFSWLVPLVGPEAARRLVTQAAGSPVPARTRDENGGSEPTTPRRRHPRHAVQHRRRRPGTDQTAAVRTGSGRGARRPARRAS